MLKRLKEWERRQLRGNQDAWLTKANTKACKPVVPVRHLKTDRHKHLVTTVANILVVGKPTAFSLESSCRHGIRSGLCLDGWTWRDADAAAASVVGSALKRIGVVRPTWWQGQPDSAAEGLVFVERTYCECCRGKMPKALAVQTGWTKRYCSKLCNEKARHRYERSYGKQRSIAELHMAQKAMGERKRQLRERFCVQCNELFVPDYSSMGLYCSRSCAGLGNRGRRVPLPKCVACGKECKQTRTKYCSKACFRETIAAAPKSCGGCSTAFTPFNKQTATCSRSCGYKLQGLRKSSLTCEAA